MPLRAARRCSTGTRQVGAVEVWKVKQVVDDALALARVERVLQQLEIGHAVNIRYDDLAIQPGAFQAKLLMAAACFGSLSVQS